MLWICSLANGAEVRNIAGDGISGYRGDGGEARNAQVGGPFGLVIGPDGGLYVCEIANHCIRRIDLKSGTISTVAGSGKPGYAGDGGPATKALCFEPYEVRFDAEGNMFFVEMKNHLVRRVDARTEIISTVAGTGKAGFSGDGMAATKAELKQPHSIALPGDGFLYIADIGNHRIRRVDLNKGTIETVSGTGMKGALPEEAALRGTALSGPRALDAASPSEMFLALREGHAIFRIDLKKERLYHLSGNGKPGYRGDGEPAIEGQFNGPKGISVGPRGDVYIADTENHVIRVIRKGSGKLETLVGDGKRGDGPEGDPRKCRLAQPHGVFAAADGRVFIGDSSNHRVRVYVP
ncbi:MAG: hypothetical protein U0903_00015 [Planctomycetales bacterium]